MKVVKVNLPTGKVVLLRTMKISDTEKAAQEVASRSNGDSNVMQILMQKAILKNLLVATSEDGVKPPEKITANQREDLDEMFTLSEYGQLLKVVGKMSGADDMSKEAKIEHITFE